VQIASYLEAAYVRTQASRLQCKNICLGNLSVFVAG
jgi:hypothetical protein